MSVRTFVGIILISVLSAMALSIVIGCTSASKPTHDRTHAVAARADGSVFQSPQVAVPLIAELLRGEKWKELAGYYDLSGSGIDFAELESGRYFIRTERPATAHPAGFWKYRHPFAPGFQYEHEEQTGDPRIVKVTVSIAIDQGGGLIQRGFQTFQMRRVDGGWKILPLIEMQGAADSPASAVAADYKPKLGADQITDLRPDLAGALAALPPTAPESTVPLLRLLQQYQRGEGLPAAPPSRPAPSPRRIPGEPAVEAYDPTDQQLLISEVGDRLEWILEHHHPAKIVGQLQSAGWTSNHYDYQQIVIRHSDVIGSGRFFYADKPMDRRVMLPRKMPGF